MKYLICVTLPGKVENEARLINQLFSEGLEILHIRKPDLSVEQVEILLKGIDSKYRKRITIHENYTLALKYQLGGVHFKEKYFKQKLKFKMLVSLFKLFGYRLSLSLHDLEDVYLAEKQFSEIFDYIFLGPIFESISKPGYSNGLDMQKLAAAIPGIKTPLVAIGGVAKENIYTVEQLGFAGAAMIGSIWSNSNPAQAFRDLVNI